MDIPDMNNIIDQSSIIKSFEFTAEDVTLTLYIRKTIYKDYFKMFIDANVEVKNKDIRKLVSENGSSVYTTLTYKNNSFFWLGTNDWKGLRWKSFKNETKVEYYIDLKGMKDRYIEQSKFITLISNYFYESMHKFKNFKILYETEIDEIYFENEK